MSGRLAAVALAGVLVSIASCAQIWGLDDDFYEAAGGSGAGASGGATGSGATAVGGGGGSGGSGGDSSCTSDADCRGLPATYCDGGTCVAKKPSGQACTGDNECVDGACPEDDGVCCDAPCTGTCEACVRSKTGAVDGTCAVVLAGTDPETECEEEDPTTCGTDGTGCSGVTAACKLHDATTVCSGASCAAGTETAQGLCDGAGTCVAPMTGCAPYVCDLAGVSCLGSCVNDTACVATHYCLGGLCVAKKQLGGACTGTVECLSGICVDSVCCDDACLGTCRACSSVKTGASNGTCADVQSGQDPDAECSVAGESCIGGLCKVCGVPATPPGVPCPANCGGCPNGVCVIDCKGIQTCKADTIACPPDLPCRVDCSAGDQSCLDAVIQCPDTYTCEVDCSGGIQSCGGNFQMSCSGAPCTITCGAAQQCLGAAVACGPDACTAACSGGDEPQVTCGSSCSCTPCP